jgi:hypothetical protein
MTTTKGPIQLQTQKMKRLRNLRRISKLLNPSAKHLLLEQNATHRPSLQLPRNLALQKLRPVKRLPKLQ